MTDGALLAVRRLEVRYRRTEAVRGVTFEVGAGEVLGLIGPDGAGKTSTLRVLGGLMRASGGTAEAFGASCWGSRRALHHRLGYLAQRFALYGDLTVDENVQFFALMYGVAGWRERRRRLLELVGLDRFRGRLAEQLSGGMKQKLALACTLIHSPEVLLLDEPTTGVDPVTRRELWRLLGELVGDGLTLVVATPYLDEAERCTRVVLMHHGEVIADGRPSAIPATMPGTVVEIAAGDRATASDLLAAAADIADVSVFGTTLHARLEQPPEAAERRVRELLGASGPEIGVRAIRPSLEDAFLYLTTHERSRAEAT
ncbi:MAG: ABC transporter ATP-binding protein [Thermoanaerobaculales bacterium]|nr:ABC transporter ATP-binding protein [Thermoanaerobaculales bacterium]